MYTLDQIRRGLSHPNYIGRELNRLYFTRLYSRPYNIDGVDIFGSDWDNLIILDACRYDMFHDQSELPGQLETRDSRGSTTTEFLSANFTDRDLTNTVYVTANPQLYRHASEIDPNLHNVIHVWSKSGWDEEHSTVLPERGVGLGTPHSPPRNSCTRGARGLRAAPRQETHHPLHPTPLSLFSFRERLRSRPSIH